MSYRRLDTSPRRYSHTHSLSRPNSRYFHYHSTPPHLAAPMLLWWLWLLWSWQVLQT